MKMTLENKSDEGYTFLILLFLHLSVCNFNNCIYLKLSVQVLKDRENYNEQDMLEAIRLVKEDDFSIRLAASTINDCKLNAVPRHDIHIISHLEQFLKSLSMIRTNFYCKINLLFMVSS
jgi:hypothetical protein